MNHFTDERMRLPAIAEPASDWAESSSDDDVQLPPAPSCEPATNPGRRPGRRAEQLAGDAPRPSSAEDAGAYPVAEPSAADSRFYGGWYLVLVGAVAFFGAILGSLVAGRR